MSLRKSRQLQIDSYPANVMLAAGRPVSDFTPVRLKLLCFGEVLTVRFDSVRQHYATKYVAGK
jgi:hypothetical protein